MISFTTGNILKADVEALVNTVNTVGIMGKGIALQFKKEFPDNYKVYKHTCDNNELETGKMLVTQTGRLTPKYIINFPTKQHWRGRSQLEYIKKGMQNLVDVITEKDIKSIAIPPLGSGNGGLDWAKVKPIVLQMLEPIKEKVNIIIYEPGYNNQQRTNKPVKELTPARGMLLCALNNYEVLGYEVNMLVVQKLAYFLSRLGEPLNLKFEKGYYGPYSHQLFHLLKRLNGYYIQFKGENPSPGVQVKINQMQQVKEYCDRSLTDEQQERLKKLQDVIHGFESPYGVELLATIDFIQQQSNENSYEGIVQEISNWTNRKRDLMKPYHIQVAHQRIQHISGLLRC